MKTAIKRSLSIFLAITIIFSSAYVGVTEIDFSGLFVVKAEAVDASNLVFALNDDGKSYFVDYCDSSANGEVVIPDKYNGLPVTSISFYAFEEAVNVESIVLPYSIIEINDGSGKSCNNLVSIKVDRNNPKFSSSDGILFSKDKTTLFAYPQAKKGDSYKVPGSVKNVAEFAFYNSNLKEIILPDSIKEIGRGAFACCDNLDSLIIPDGVTKLGRNIVEDSYNYENNEYWEDNKWDNSVLYIDNYLIAGDYYITGKCDVKPGTKLIAEFAFYECDELEGVTLPDSLIAIGDYAFSNCINLSSVSLPDSITEIPSGAFNNCEKLKNIILPNKLLRIGKFAFCECGLESILLPKTLEMIDLGAFWSTKFKSITIPSNVKSIGKAAFCDSAIEKIDLNDGLETIGISAFELCENLKNITVPDTVKELGKDAFKYSNVETVKLSKNLKTIGNETFYDCKNLKSIILPQNLKIIRNGAFENCKSLASISIPDSVTTIGDDAFFNCDSLMSITIPESVKNIGAYALGYELCGVQKTGFVICGVKGSVAETYAKSNSIKFIEKDALNQHKKLSKPKLSKIQNTASGVKITWGKVNGADKYYVYRKVKGGSYSKIGTTTKTYFTDKKASSGKKYYYYVKAVNEAGSSSASSSKSIYYLADPTLKTPTSTKKGVVLKWNKITGAQGYVVYYKTGSGSYKKLATVKGNKKVTYTHTKSKKGKKYTYKVKAYYSKTYSAYSNTKTIKDKY